MDPRSAVYNLGEEKRNLSCIKTRQRVSNWEEANEQARDAQEYKKEKRTKTRTTWWVLTVLGNVEKQSCLHLILHLSCSLHSEAAQIEISSAVSAYVRPSVPVPWMEERGMKS